MTPSDLDRVDHRILELLQQNARSSNADIARELGMAPSAILERIRKLEQRGILLGYEARIEPRAIGLGLTAFVLVRSSESGSAEETSTALAAIPEVQEVHHVAGEDCFLVKMRARDTTDLARLLNERLKVLPHIRQTRTTIVLSSVKETSRLPLGAAPRGEADAS